MCTAWSFMGEGWPSRVPLSSFCGTEKELYIQERRATGEWSDVLRSDVTWSDEREYEGLRIQEAKATKKEHILFGQITPIKGTKDCLRLLRSFQGPSFAGLPLSRAGPQPDSS